MIKITPLGSSFVFLTTAIWLANTDEKVLMVMTSGDGSDINSLWNTEGGVNETTPEMADWPVRELLSHGTFRSSVVDLWPYGIPEHMTLEAVNAVGTPLWWVMLSTSGTDKSLTSWLKPTLMLTSSSYDMIETSDRTIYLE
ncbi:uncharacterized protein [Argopecten irradians]|uniref:uncharacterized protein n=1 Tax=Argopecten irradians TaxID=31199 RepID=UPI003720AE00